MRRKEVRREAVRARQRKEEEMRRKIVAAPAGRLESLSAPKKMIGGEGLSLAL